MRTTAKPRIQQGERQGDGRQDAEQRSDDAKDEVLPEKVKAKGEAALEDDQDQSNVAEREKCLLPFQGQDVRDGDAVDQADRYLTDQPGAEDLIGQPSRDGQRDEEGDQSQHADDVRLKVLEECAAWVGGHGEMGGCGVMRVRLRSTLDKVV